MSWQTELAAARRDAASLAKHMATLNALVGDSVAQVAEIGKGMGIDVNLSAVEASLRIPYVLWRVSPEEWKVLVWRGRADMPLIGIPDFQTDGFVISTLNRGARLFTDVPEEIEKIVGWEKPAFETRFNAARTEIRVTRGEPDRFKAKYGRYLGERGAEGFKVKKGQAWLDLLAHLLDDDIVPHSVVPVDPHDWDANAPCQIEFAGKRAYQMGYVEQFLRDGSETVLLPSGAGKTFIALFLISHIVGPQYIFCDSDVLVGQWKNRIADKAPHRIKDVRVVTYQWAATHVNEIAGVLGIFDEAHRQVAPTWTRLVFARLKYHVSMTATPGDKKRRAMLVALGGNVRLTPFAELIDAGALSRPETYCYQVRDASYKLAWTKKLLHDNPRQRTWIFCDTLALGHELSRQLGLPFIYGDTPHKYERVAEERQCILSKAMEASLDFSDLELVVDYDVSKTGRSPVSAGQRIGRGMHAAACKYYILMTPDELARYGDRLVGIEMQIGDVIKYVDLTGEGRIKLSAPRKTRAKPTSKVVVKEGDKVGAILAAPAIRRLILDHEKNLGATRQGYMAKAFRVLWKSSGTSEELRLRAGKAAKTWEWYQAGMNELVKAGLAKKVKKRYSLDQARINVLTR